MTPQNSPIKLTQRNWFKNLMTVLIVMIVYLALRPFMQGDVIEGEVPIMRLESISGQPLDLQALNQQGQPVLIHFWATWCPICKFTRDGVESVAQDYAVINIATQSGDDQLLLDYAKAHGMNPALIVNDADGKWMQAFGAKAVPADFIIAPNGDITFVEVGYTSSIGLRLRLWWASLN